MDESDYFDYFDSAAILKGVIIEIQSLLDENPQQKDFYFIEIMHCFDQYEIVREHLILKDKKFGMVPKVRDNLEASPEFQYDIITRRYMQTLVAHAGTCIDFIARRLDESRIQAFEAQVENADIELAKPTTFTQDELDKLVHTIIKEFTIQVEDRGGWKLFWDRGAKKHVWEDVAQNLFYMFASTICKANGIDISPETNAGAGSVDFKFSVGATVKHLVEFKMSDNPKLVPGYTKQLGAYNKAEQTAHASYVVIEVSNIEKERAELNELASNDSANPHVFYIDVKPRPSASLL